MSSFSNRFNLKTRAVLLLGLLTVIFFIFFVIQIATPSPTLGGIQAEQTDASDTVLPAGGKVIFNTVLNDQSDNISYNATTGEFTITKPGNYYVDWWVNALNPRVLPLSLTYSIAVNDVPYSSASYPPTELLRTQLSGETLVTVTMVPTTITLINATGSAVIIPTAPVQADIVIAEVTR